MKDWRDFIPPTAAAPWSDEEIGRLRQMWVQGVLVHAIARELGRLPGAVRVRACMLALPKRGLGNGRQGSGWAPDDLPAGLRYEDDPRAEAEFNKEPALVCGDVTAALMGDPAPGRSAA